MIPDTEKCDRCNKTKNKVTLRVTNRPPRGVSNDGRLGSYYACWNLKCHEIEEAKKC